MLIYAIDNAVYLYQYMKNDKLDFSLALQELFLSARYNAYLFATIYHFY